MVSSLAVRHLSKNDPVLARLIERVGPYRLVPKPTSSVFAALAEAIVYQQLHAKAAASIFARVCQLFPRPSAPSARALPNISDEALRAAGLSRMKLLALRDLGEKVNGAKLPPFSALHAMSDEEIIERLTTVRGIGPWTVHMLLMFRLGRPDVLPVDDFGVLKGFSVVFRGSLPVTKRELEAHALRWRPYRSVASWYMWRALELEPRAVATKPKR
jgi:3-methyladenine DNA glycosylase/8-oxoguanine DNA glycosylase